MNYRDNVTNTFMHIQSYSYKSDLGLYDAITQEGRAQRSGRHIICLIHETLAAPHFFNYFYFSFDPCMLHIILF